MIIAAERFCGGPETSFRGHSARITLELISAIKINFLDH